MLTDDFAPGAWTHTGWRGELRLEYLDQKTLRSGTHSPDPEALSQEEAIERESRSTNLIGSLDYRFNPKWSVALQLPLINRAHSHDLRAEGSDSATTPESWAYTRMGDARVLARYQHIPSDDASTLFGLVAGFKLPTGSTSVTNADGAAAERTLQPGTGTLDLILGANARAVLTPSDAMFGAFTTAVATNSHDDYKPGNRVELSGGWSHAVSPSWGTALQLNYLHKGRDSGEQAEPDNSGLDTVQLSPGLTVALSDNTSAYGFVQLPLYQHVNGIQLVQKWSLALGLSSHF
ncbi:hypothetical protein GCM10025771_29860 [Niveibacterium umoris]